MQIIGLVKVGFLTLVLWQYLEEKNTYLFKTIIKPWFLITCYMETCSEAKPKPNNLILTVEKSAWK